MTMNVKVAGAWQTAAAKVKVAGTWKSARSWMKVNGLWRREVHDFDLTTSNSNPRGIAWDGAYFYVVDYYDKKVYVYDADGDPQSDRDFDLTASDYNYDPRGIAWDGAYFYLVDYYDKKVYVYDADGTPSQTATSTSPPATTPPGVSPGMEHTSTWWTT